MTPSRALASAALIAATLTSASACNREDPPAADTVHFTPTDPAPSVDADVAAQNRINAFMFVAVLPKVQPCWGRLQGSGSVVFKYTYRRNGTNWVWSTHGVESSTLDKGQEPTALQCMTEAARGSAFPMEASEAARRGDEMNIHWEWPVPLPGDVTTLARIISGGGGKECSKSCVKCDCPFLPGTGVVCSCASACSGYTAPCVLDANKKGCSMKLPACATGRMGGFGGGIVIAKASGARSNTEKDLSTIHPEQD
jgi:hypothetical protein